MATETNAPLTHSPAPWSCNRDGLIRDADGNVVAQMSAMPDDDATMANAELVEASPDLLREGKETRDLCMALATVAFTDAVQDHLPYGLRERVDAWVAKVGGIDAAIRKAEGMGR